MLMVLYGSYYWSVLFVGASVCVSWYVDRFLGTFSRCAMFRWCKCTRRSRRPSNMYHCITHYTWITTLLLSSGRQHESFSLEYIWIIFDLILRDLGGEIDNQDTRRDSQHETPYQSLISTTHTRTYFIRDGLAAWRFHMSSFADLRLYLMAAGSSAQFVSYMGHWLYVPQQNFFGWKYCNIDRYYLRRSIELTNREICWNVLSKCE